MQQTGAINDHIVPDESDSQQLKRIKGSQNKLWAAIA